MIPLPGGTRIFLRPGKTDGRQGINGLSILAEAVMKENPFSGNLFLNKRGTTIKALYWDRNGFCLWPNDWRKTGSTGLREPGRPGNSPKRNCTGSWTGWTYPG